MTTPAEKAASRLAGGLAATRRIYRIWLSTTSSPDIDVTDAYWAEPRKGALDVCASWLDYFLARLDATGPTSVPDCPDPPGDWPRGLGVDTGLVNNYAGAWYSTEPRLLLDIREAISLIQDDPGVGLRTRARNSGLLVNDDIEQVGPTVERAARTVGPPWMDPLS